MNTIQIYTDGSCNVQQKIGGYGLISTNNAIKESGKKTPTTNNEMELTAILRAIELAQEQGYEKIEIYSDSEYAIKSVSEWACKWEKNNWTKKKGKIKNLKLIKEIFKKVKENDISFHHVKGHSGNEINEYADKLAKSAYK